MDDNKMNLTETGMDGEESIQLTQIGKAGFLHGNKLLGFIE
jgi:hypothetical protein